MLSDKLLNELLVLHSVFTAAQAGESFECIDKISAPEEVGGV